jgi:hypothetical protein
MDEKQYVEVRFLQIGLRIDETDGIGGPQIKQTGQASGSTRMWLAELPDWLDSNPGVLVTAIRPV